MNIDHFEWEPTWQNVLDLLTMISRDSVRSSLEFSYEDNDQEDGPLDTEDYPPVNMPNAYKIDLINGFQMASQMPPVNAVQWERLSVYGDETDPVDIAAYKRTRQAVSDFLGDVITAHAGEEADKEQWHEALSVTDGLVLIEDSVDGTTPMRCLRMGFSHNMGLYEAVGEHRRLLAIVCTSSSMETMVVDLRNNVVTMISMSDTRRAVTDHEPFTRCVQGSFAVVSARGSVRAQNAELFDPDLDLGLPPSMYGGQTDYKPAPSVYTVGGAPIIIGFPLSELQFLYVPHEQTPYDAFPLVGAVMAGHRYIVLNEDGTNHEASVDEMISWLSTLTGPQSATPRPVPRGLLVRSGTNEALVTRTIELLRQKV